ncbi:MAG: glycosyltransferase family 2 protein [Candidatus Omnitrophica bacterium]|nr:glycosyltransferase family 2 protein [Candidatus Omnitrophota bacterium]MBU1128573.1 glycosyltransferase family 2 protein [Candidatus Omnitrophota bacterium]MBU1657241.1 glycosyltransferase family 2 protein [Candidatus Omnitrophota bacterium]MBU1784786.1 glycosyltransferase family 2 protein [Candidatus Omnitrophota bacterium]MBU1851577.1 glycosyltransferase family 2 protein [Candidatus Omnitrophota bacterium]
MTVNIIVLNYNGENIIPKCLPSIIEAARVSRHEVTVTVVDNESTDLSVEILKKYDDIKILPLKNRILCSFNDAVRMQDEDIAILLNNDIRVDNVFIDPLVDVFEHQDDVFMTAPKCFDFDGVELEGGRSKGFVKLGWFGAMARYDGWEKEVDKFGITFQSGFGAVRKDRFLELGGYDDMYLPGRLEDSDIGFRAWKRGWASYYCPDSVVYHMGGESFNKKFGKKGVSAIDSRNSSLFFWKNISDPGLWVSHVLFLPLRILWWLTRGDIAAVKGFFQALKKVPEVVERRKVLPASDITDKEIFDKFRR